MTELKKCPLCGVKPKLPDCCGTQYELWCDNCGMVVSSIQISDLMTIEERLNSRDLSSENNYKYEQEYIDRAEKEAIQAWNNRPIEQELQQLLEINNAESKALVMSQDESIKELQQKIDELKKQLDIEVEIRKDAVDKRWECMKENAELKKQNEWQPIETAPKDGTSVLVHSYKWIEPTMMYYSSEEYFEEEYGDSEYMESGWYVSHGMDFDQPDEYTREPTHWMPLPTPPKEE